MLIEFKVANFRSLREEQVFSLVASNYEKNLLECLVDCELPGLAGTKFLKGAAIYGANASGKSNIIEAIHYVEKLVRNSATKLQPNDPTGTQPFKLDRSSIKQPSKFEITFVSDGIRYVFGLSVTPQRVVEEFLVAYPNGIAVRWYHRMYNAETQSYDWAKSSSQFKRDKSLQDKTRENALFLSVAAQFNHPQLTSVYNWFDEHLRFIQLSSEGGIPPNITADLVAKSAYRARILNLLKSADIGVMDAQVIETEISVDELKHNIPPKAFVELEKNGNFKSIQQIQINLTHSVGTSNEIPLDFEGEESAGTRRFFALIGPWLEILENGYTVFVDEIDISLHPILVKELLKLLLCNESNPKGAQVVFTTHNPVLLDNSLLRRDQIWFTEKSSEGATNLYPLTDFNPRKDEALAKGYLAGRYGAIPYLPEGLQL